MKARGLRVTVARPMAAVTMVVGTMMAGCAGESGTPPSPEPPPPWGVPISGGTMLVTRDGAHAVIADPDRDRVMAVDVQTGATTELALQAHDEPGRLVEDGAGRVHVALRRGGAVVTIDPALSQVTARRAVCAEPRGLVWDAASDALHVACSTGELVSLPAAGGAATRTLRLERDLRDVIVDGDHLVVSKFRSAELLTIDASGAIAERNRSPVTHRRDGFGPTGALLDAVAGVAWRTVPIPGGGYVMLHQRAIERPLDISASGGGYTGGGCSESPIETAFTVVRRGQRPASVTRISLGTLVVDVAVNADGDLAMASPGSLGIRVVSGTLLNHADEDDCPRETSPGEINQEYFDSLGAPTSVAWTPSGELLTYYPELPALVVRSGAYLASARTFKLPGELGYDSGRALFHTRTAAAMACASCHPEGREDGRVWEFRDVGMRRTQSLAGNILARGPYHWTADLEDLPSLMSEVFTRRMGGSAVTHSQSVSLGPWLDRVPAPAPSSSVDAAAAARGKLVFESPTAACTICHNGPLLTNNQRFDVGTGEAVKVPSLLGVSARAPFLHDGCAPTLRDRFGACGGGEKHGTTAQLSSAQLDDLIAYLESL